MDRIKNPFSPGAGSPPPELVGYLLCHLPLSPARRLQVVLIGAALPIF